MDQLSESLQHYFDLMTYQGAAYLFHMGNNLGLMSYFIKQNPSVAFSSAAMAKDLQLDPRPLNLLLDCYIELGVLAKSSNDQQYLITPLLRMVSGPYRDLGQEYWNHLPALLKTGQPLKQMDDPKESEKEYVKQAESLYWMMAQAAHRMAEILQPAGDSLQILDLGAGSGVWSNALLIKNRSASATLVDWPSVLEIAHRFSIQNGTNDRIRLFPGNYHELNFEENFYDFIILGNVAHIEKVDALNALFSKSRSALKQNGKIIILDVFPHQQQGKLSARLYSLGLALRTQFGKTYSYSELTNLLSASFKNITLTDLAVPPHTMSLVTAQKIAE